MLFLILTSAAKINDTLAMYDRVDKLTEPTPSSNKYPTLFGARPTPDMNPYNAWWDADQCTDTLVDQFRLYTIFLQIYVSTVLQWWNDDEEQNKEQVCYG